MDKIKQEQNLDSMLKSARDRVKAQENIQYSFNAFNDFINLADQKLNNKLDKLENVVDDIQKEQKKALKQLHKETVQESLRSEFADDINRQYRLINDSLEKATDALRSNDERIDQRYLSLYKNSIVSFAFKSWHGLFYIFYLIVCVGSLVSYNSIDNAIHHETITIWRVSFQMLTYALIAVIPISSWGFFLSDLENTKSYADNLLNKASTIGFSLGFIVFSIVYYFVISG